MIRALLPIFLISVYSAASFACERVDLATHNDAFNGGFGDVTDDFRSFGWWADVRCGPIDAELDFSGFTDRARETRVDSLWLGATALLFSNERATLRGGAGAWFTGRLGGEQTQNRVHRATGHPEVFFPFDHRFKFRPMIGLSTELDAIRVPDLAIGLVSESWIGAHSAITKNAAKLDLGRGNAHLISTFGFTQSFSQNIPTLQQGLAQENGFRFAIESRVAFLFVTWDFSTDPQKHALGMIGASLTPFDVVTDPFETHDVSFAFGPALIPFESYVAEYRVPVAPMLQVGLLARFGPYPVDALNDFPNVRGGSQSLALEASFHPLSMLSFFRVDPFVTAGVGLRNDRFFGSSFDRIAVRRAELETRVGVTLSTGGFWLLDRNVRYGVHNFYGVSYSPPQTVQLPTQSVTLGGMDPFIGIGLNLDVDLVGP